MRPIIQRKEEKEVKEKEERAAQGREQDLRPWVHPGLEEERCYLR